MSLIDILKNTLSFKKNKEDKPEKKAKNTYDNVSNDDDKAIHKAEKAMTKGKSITLDQPMSERYPNYNDQSGESKLDKMTVSSTAIDTIKYDPKTRIANVRFVNGDKFYSFPDVPQEEISRWMRARSKGKYYNSDFKQYSVKGFRG